MAARGAAQAEALLRSSAARGDFELACAAGAIAAHAREWELAEPLASRALALQPGHVSALLLTGHVARGLQRWPEARDAYARAADRAPEAPQPRLHLALLAIEVDDPQAGDALADFAARFPGQSDSLMQIGRAAQGRGRFDVARAAFARAAAAMPDDVVAQMSLGAACLADGAADAAMAPLRRAQELAPKRADADFLLARALRETGAAQEARTRLSGLAARAPDARVFFALGLACDDLGDWTGAAAAYGRCLEYKPDLAEAMVNLGLALQRLGHFDQARTLYARAYAARPAAIGHIAQALASSARGEIFLSAGALKRTLVP